MGNEVKTGSNVEGALPGSEAVFAGLLSGGAFCYKKIKQTLTICFSES